MLFAHRNLLKQVAVNPLSGLEQMRDLFVSSSFSIQVPMTRLLGIPNTGGEPVFLARLHV
jgi:hypothetical protein